LWSWVVVVEVVGGSRRGESGGKFWNEGFFRGGGKYCALHSILKVGIGRDGTIIVSPSGFKVLEERQDQPLNVILDISWQVLSCYHFEQWAELALVVVL
nr:hypothetical protein [Tanacetum cinerariifolium]